MGSWNETCGISRLPIVYNDECVMVVIKSDVLNHGMWNLNRLFLTSDVMYIGKGKYADYGCIDTFEDDPLWIGEKSKQNEYGIDETCYERRCCTHDDLETIFFRKDMWDMVINFCDTYISDAYDKDSNREKEFIKKNCSKRLNDRVSEPDFEEFWKVLTVCNAHRLNIRTREHCGKQDDCVLLLKYVAEATLKVINDDLAKPGPPFDSLKWNDDYDDNGEEVDEENERNFSYRSFWYNNPKK